MSSRKKILFTSKNISFKIRKNLLNTYIWVIDLYKCKNLIIAAKEKEKFKIIEM